VGLFLRSIKEEKGRLKTSKEITESMIKIRPKLSQARVLIKVL
jgi:hypothetical protein